MNYVYTFCTINTLLSRLPIHPRVDYFIAIHCFEPGGVDYVFEVLIIFSELLIILRIHC